MIEGTESRYELRPQTSVVHVDRTPAQVATAVRTCRLAVRKAQRAYDRSEHTRADRRRRDRAVSVALRQYRGSVAPVRTTMTTMHPVVVESSPFDIAGSL